MKLINLKSDADGDYCAPMPMERYGYGLRICLDDDQCAKLGLTKALRPGTQVRISAQAVVVSSTESLDADQDEGGNEVQISLQITDMGVEPGSMLRNAAAMLYGDG